MRITKFGHACVRLAGPAGDLVIDPGLFTGPESVDGAAAVIVTHDHFDHLAPARLAALDVPIWGPASIVEAVRAEHPELAERISVLAPGDVTTLAGLQVTGFGGQHAEIHPDIPRAVNVGVVVTDGTTTVAHPGDAFEVPPVPVDVLLLPVTAPWLKFSEVIDFGRAVKAPTALAVHDMLASEVALPLIDNVIGGLLGKSGVQFVRRAAGEDLA